MITNKEIFDLVQKNYNGDLVFCIAHVIRKVMDAKYEEDHDTPMYKNWNSIMTDVENYNNGFITKHELYNRILNVVLRMDVPNEILYQDWYIQHTLINTIYNIIEDRYAK